MPKIHVRRAPLVGVAAALVALPLAAQASTLGPDPVIPSDLTVSVEYVTTMPVEVGPTSRPNLASPVTVKNKLYLIDQQASIYRVNDKVEVQQVFDIGEAPDGLTLDNRNSILNIAPGPTKNSMYVAFTSGTAPTSGVPIYRLPAPLPGQCCNPAAPVPVDDLYRIGVPPPGSPYGPTRTEFQVIYQYDIRGDSLANPSPIAAFETQSGATHNGGGMVRLDDGRLLFATGDALPEGTDGRAAPQDPSEVVGKLLIVDPDNGSIELAAVGVRNVQRIEHSPDGRYLGFADIGAATAEEINYIAVDDVLDTSVVENFGWGRNADGYGREGTFYVGPGIALVPFTNPPAVAAAPVPEPGFRQPQSQYGRENPFSFVAVSGPVTSDKSFDELTAVFTDLSTGRAYGSVAGPDQINSPVLGLNLVEPDGTPIADGFNTLADGRADPRLFRFPDGTAGVLLEATGDLYRLTEVAPG